MKTREQIITDMCYTMRHDYGIVKPELTEEDERDFYKMLSSGMTESEREDLRRRMSQLFDNCIAHHMEFKK